MADTGIAIELSPFQSRRIAQLADEITKLQALQQEAIQAIVGGKRDPALMAGWSIALQGDTILCTPPRDASDTGPSLVE